MWHPCENWTTHNGETVTAGWRAVGLDYPTAEISKAVNVFSVSQDLRKIVGNGQSIEAGCLVLLLARYRRDGMKPNKCYQVCKQRWSSAAKSSFLSSYCNRYWQSPITWDLGRLEKSTASTAWVEDKASGWLLLITSHWDSSVR